MCVQCFDDCSTCDDMDTDICSMAEAVEYVQIDEEERSSGGATTADHNSSLFDPVDK